MTMSLVLILDRLGMDLTPHKLYWVMGSIGYYNHKFVMTAASICFIINYNSDSMLTFI